MIQLALRSSIQAEPPVASARSSRIEGSATAVIISSRPARNTPVAEHAEQHERRAAIHAAECIGRSRSNLARTVATDTDGSSQADSGGSPGTG